MDTPAKIASSSIARDECSASSVYLPDPYRRQKVIYVSCAHAKIDADQRTHDCLHMISPATLIAWRQDDCRSISATRGDCDVCPQKINVETFLEHKINVVNEKLHHHHINGMILHWLDEQSWCAERALSLEISARLSADSPSVARRALLRRLFSTNND